MASDELTFFIGFAAIFAGLGWYLWHLERQVAQLARRVEDARAAQHERGPSVPPGVRGPAAPSVDPPGTIASAVDETRDTPVDDAPASAPDYAATPKRPDQETGP